MSDSDEDFGEFESSILFQDTVETAGQSSNTQGQLDDSTEAASQPDDSTEAVSQPSNSSEAVIVSQPGLSTNASRIKMSTVSSSSLNLLESIKLKGAENWMQ